MENHSYYITIVLPEWSNGFSFIPLVISQPSVILHPSIQACHAAERQPAPAELLRRDRLGASLEEVSPGFHRRDEGMMNSNGPLEFDFPNSY